MKRHVVAAIALAALSLRVASAFDADALAFYAFDGGTAGASAIGGIVENKVDPTKYGGVISRSSLGGEGSWSDDQPATYVFAKGGYKPELLCTNPRSVKVADYSNGRGIVCDFDSVASELGDLSEWTVEWFQKFPTNLTYVSYYGFFTLPLRTTDLTGTTASALCLTMTADSYFRLHSYNQGNGYAGLMSLKSADKWDPQLSGLWHHYAISYKNNKATLTVDYKYSVTTTQTISPTNIPVALQLPGPGTKSYGAFHGSISCVRVSKKSLSVEDYMVASNDPDCHSRTVFHWALDGEPGAMSPDSISNRAWAVSAAAVNPGVYAMTNLTGVGVYNLNTNGNRSVFCAELPKGSTRNRVFEDRKGDLLGDNLSSLRIPTLPLSVSAPTTDPIWTTGTKLTINAAHFHPVDSSFTMEMFVKMNYDDWNVNTQYTSGGRRRTTIMGMSGGYGYHAWALYILPNGTGNDSLTLSAYNNVSDSTAQTMAASVAFSRNGWHHVAVTYDASTNQLRLYVDYKQAGTTLTLSGPLKFGTLSSQSYSVGGGLNNHSFDGWVDEVRLVRECLSPDKFMWLSSGLGMTLMFK
ncbi:MAG: hypothetical protein IJI35_00960 [Kiritimatiellae bacterium]|nr:hypothetical protein [Kiritimatiellia bacterium]MBQ6327558.1 hypothetical protein [Kiritimatiellia bacterium]